MEMMRISDAEWKIMNELWEKEPLTMMQITKALSETTKWSKHTVMTYLKRLEEKKAIHFVEGVKAKEYYADLKKEDAMLYETNSFLEKVFRGNRGLMITTMIEKNELSDEDIEQLIDILNEKRNS